MSENEKNPCEGCASGCGKEFGTAPERVEFTKEMKKDYTILIPNMLEIHFRLLRNVFRSSGYKMELLTNDRHAVVETGLKYVHKGGGGAALLVIGQMIDALKSGKYDLSKTALMITQRMPRVELHTSSQKGADKGRTRAYPGHLTQSLRTREELRIPLDARYDQKADRRDGVWRPHDASRESGASV